jgi:hypothetical protein
MKVGGDRKKIVILGGLMLVLGYILFSSLFSSSEAPPAPRPADRSARPARAARPEAAETVTVRAQTETRPRPSTRPQRGGGAQQLKLSFRENDKAIDPATVDPTLRLDLLAKVQAVTLPGSDRNLFQFGSAPPPPVKDVKIVPQPVAPPDINVPKDVKPTPPPEPPPPPIPLEFYGYSSQPKQGHKRAFFLAGDEIILAGEGDMIKRRYKVISIGVNSAVVEDTEFKNNKQTLQLKEMQG